MFSLAVQLLGSRQVGALQLRARVEQWVQEELQRGSDRPGAYTITGSFFLSECASGYHHHRANSSLIGAFEMVQYLIQIIDLTALPYPDV
jgi:hypothetical protein